MTRTLAVFLPAFGAIVSAWMAPSRNASSAGHRPTSVEKSPTVLELFQSQGCSSCPPALEVLRQEADRKDVIALSFAVTYWDQLGWKDLFARPAFTSRQWDYAHANRHAVVATPQLVVNGRGFVNGGSRSEVEAAISEYPIPSGGPTLRLDHGKLVVGASSAGRRATVWLVSYDPRTLQVPIRAGENGGRTLAHRNIVRAIEKLGSWTGTEHSYEITPASSGMDRAVLVQAGTGGPIIAARGLT